MSSPTPPASNAPVPSGSGGSPPQWQQLTRKAKTLPKGAIVAIVGGALALILVAIVAVVLIVGLLMGGPKDDLVGTWSGSCTESGRASLTLHENGTVGSSGQLVGRWSVNDGYLKFDMAGEETSVKYELDGDHLILISGDGTCSYTRVD